MHILSFFCFCEVWYLRTLQEYLLALLDLRYMAV